MKKMKKMGGREGVARKTEKKEKKIKCNINNR